jgi:hypothetical protein
MTILEDDNTWEPQFLETCIKCLLERPHVSLVWCNMELWKESAPGECRPTGQLFWPAISKSGLALPEVKEFHWPNAFSMMGGLHSNGACVMRADHLPAYAIPNECPFNFIEQVRERSFRYPIALIRKRLANWTWTMETSRPSSLSRSLAMQVMLVGTFLCHSKRDRFALRRVFSRARKRTQRQLLVLVLAIAQHKQLWPLLRYLRVSDLFWVGRDFARHPVATIRSLSERRRLRNLEIFLNRNTAERFNGGSY